MEQTNNAEFFQLLKALVQQQTVSVPNSNGSVYKFRALTANQLKELIQTLIDKSITNLSFNQALLKIMKDNAIEKELTIPLDSFNVIDKILFLLSIRIQSISDKLYILGDNNDSIEVDLNKIIDNFYELIKKDGYKFLTENTIEVENLTLTLGVPYATVEYETNKQMYTNVDFSQESDLTKLQQLVGEAFIVEITKWIKTIVIENNVLNYTDLSFEKKTKTLESLPASVVEKIIEYIEQVKQKIENCITVSNKVLPLDGSLFSVH